MEQTKALNALEPFLALTKSASSPRAAADLITRATSAPNTFIFAELLATPQIQALDNSAEYSSYLSLLKIFSYGTYTDYHSTSGLPQLNEPQTLKLRQLSFLTSAKNPSDLTYSHLLASLGLETTRELEDLVISAIYSGLVSAQLDPYNQLVSVSSVSPLRDITPNSIPSMLSILSEWSSRCVSTLADLEKQIASIKSEALKRHKEEVEWAKHIEELSEEKVASSQGQEKEKGEEKGGRATGGGSFLGVGRKLGLGAASKRGNGALDGNGDDDGFMDLDEDEDEGERRGSRSAKKRGFGLGSRSSG